MRLPPRGAARLRVSRAGPDAPWRPSRHSPVPSGRPPCVGQRARGARFFRPHRQQKQTGRDFSDAAQVQPREDPQHRDHGPHRRGQDDDDRAHPLLHRPLPQDGRGPRGRGHDGLDGAGAGARHHDHLRGHDGRVEGPSDQHHRHARPRRLHRRGRALAARPRRRDRAVRLRRRRRAPVRDGVAPGRQVRRAADRLHQQDGPHRRGLRPGRPDDDRPPRRAPRADPAADRRRGRLPRDRRPDQHEGDHLQGRARQGHRGHRDPGRLRRRRRGRARAPARRGLALRRRARRADPRGGRDPGRPADRRDPQGDAGHQAHAGAVRLLVQEQGRPAAARRRARLPAQPARRAAGRGHRAGQGRGAPPGGPQGRRQRAVRGARLQDHGRPLRRQAHLLPRLLGPPRGGLARAQHRDRAGPSGSAAS